MIDFIFWFLVFIIFYTYVGYTGLLFIIYNFKRIVGKKNDETSNYLPDVTIFIAAYNEIDIIPEKVQNLRCLDYPAEKLTFLWVTDGSDDGSEQLLQQYDDMQVIHKTNRAGKIGAINRGMQWVKSEIVIFCDANNMLSANTVKAIVKQFANKNVGCVTGEKRIIMPKKNIANAAGEGLYWRYESIIKLLESEVYSTVGAVGELCAIRTNLFEPVEPDTILDDFVISLRIAKKGYQIKYAADAIATETASVNIDEEIKRKVRIAAGCIQTLPRLKELLNIFQYGFFSFQYWSHKVLRWIVVPYALILLIPLNIYLSHHSSFIIYNLILIIQLLFYLFVFLGFLLRNRKIKRNWIILPYYLYFMNKSLIIGLFRYFSGKQTVNWEKAKRISTN